MNSDPLVEDGPQARKGQAPNRLALHPALVAQMNDIWKDMLTSNIDVRLTSGHEHIFPLVFHLRN